MMPSPDNPTGSHSACCRRHKTNLAMSSGAAVAAINHLTSCDGKPPITTIEIVKRARVWQDESQSAFSDWLRAISFSGVLLQSSHLLVDSIYWPSISGSEGSIGFHRSEEPDETLVEWCSPVGRDRIFIPLDCSVLLRQRQTSLYRFYSLEWT